MYNNLADKIICDTTNQYKYDNNVSNQCSWFVHNCANEIKNLNWNINDNNAKYVYDNALKNATNDRKKYDKTIYGNSIFSKKMFDLYKLNLLGPYQTIFHKNDTEIELDYDIELIKYKNNICEKSNNELIKDLFNAYNENYVMFISRFGESFLIYPIVIGLDIKFIIFDSHVNSIGIFNHGSVIKYILMDSEMFNRVIWMKCYKNEINTNIDKLFCDDN